MTESSSPGVVHFKTASAEVTSSTPQADRLLAGQPKQIVRNYFSDSSGQFFVGVWESTPGRWRVRYTENEFCHLTRGRIHIEDAQGRRFTFVAGDSFVIPAGFEGVWEVEEAASKLYAIFEAASK